MALDAPVYTVGQDVFFLHPTESWIRGTVKEVVRTPNKSGKTDLTYACAAMLDKATLPSITAGANVSTKLTEAMLHPIVAAGAVAIDDDGGSGGAASPVGARARSASVFFPDGRDTFNDLLDLSYLHDSTLLEQVRKRYFANLIYTRIGPIVLALNPYDYNLPHYVDAQMPKYMAEGDVVVASGGKSALLPHAWSTAHYTYWLLSKHRTNQSVIVSGESGAGKTETAKIVVKYLGCVSTSQCTDEMREAATLVTSRVNMTSPILESFGNAKTKKNDNSSRFGKFMKVHFKIAADNGIASTSAAGDEDDVDEDFKNGTLRAESKVPKSKSSGGGVMVGVSIEVYLLEKSRIVTHGEGERSYHSFYQLLALAGGQKKEPAKEALLARLQLGSAEEYANLNIGKSVTTPGVDDASDFNEVMSAMGTVGLTAAEQDGVWEVIACVIHLLGLKFSALNHDECEIEGVGDATKGAEVGGRRRTVSVSPARDIPSPATAAKNQKHSTALGALIGINMNDVAGELLTTTNTIQGEKIVRKLKKAAAIDVRDAICKYMYEALFLWLVDKIKGLVSPPEDTKDTWVGLLDIFGFENFQHNSFEQLCINLANETLQNHYNSVVFTRDMAECRDEGIDTQSVSFYDNQPCLDLISGVNFSMCGVPGHAGKSIVTSKLSIMSLLDDECSLGNGTDQSFCTKTDQSFGEKGTKGPHANYEKPKTHGNAFIIKHYAGSVKYTVDGFRAKNADTTKDSLRQMLLGSSNAFLAGVVAHHLEVQRAAAAQSPTSAGGGGGNASSKSQSVSAFFKNQLVKLMTEINGTHPHWIRCVKPHSAKKPRMFHGDEVMTQMRSAGVLETVRIRQQSFSVRLAFKEFLQGHGQLLLRPLPPHCIHTLHQRAVVLEKRAADLHAQHAEAQSSNAPAAKVKAIEAKATAASDHGASLQAVLNELRADNGRGTGDSVEQQCRRVLRRCGVDSHELAQVGKTKVFFRVHAFQRVHHQESELRHALAHVVQAHAAAYASARRVRCLQMRTFADRLKAALVARASDVVCKTLALRALEQELITKYRFLLLLESSEGTARETRYGQEALAREDIRAEAAHDLLALRAAWEEAKAVRDADARLKLEEEALAARAAMASEESTWRAKLLEMASIFDDETEGRLVVEADEEEAREGGLEAAARGVAAMLRESILADAQQRLERCETAESEARTACSNHEASEFDFLLISAKIQKDEATMRTKVLSEAASLHAAIVAAHEGGWDGLYQQWLARQEADQRMALRQLQLQEVKLRAQLLVAWEQRVIGLIAEADEDYICAARNAAIREQQEAAVAAERARRQRQVEAERRQKQLDEEREVAAAVWHAARRVEEEAKALERARQAEIQSRVGAAHANALRVHQLKEQEATSLRTGRRAAGPQTFLIPRRSPAPGSALDPSALISHRSMSPSASSPAMSARSTAMSPRTAAGVEEAVLASDAAADFTALVRSLQEIGTADGLTPRTKHKLRLQAVRGNLRRIGLQAAAVSPGRNAGGGSGASDMPPDDAFEPSPRRPTADGNGNGTAVDRHSAPATTADAAGGGLSTDRADTRAVHNASHLIGAFDRGESPLGKWSQRHPMQSSQWLVPAHGRGRQSTDNNGHAAASSVPRTVCSVEQERLARLVSAAAKRCAVRASPLSSGSIDPSDPRWAPVDGGSVVYLPDGTTLSI